MLPLIRGEGVATTGEGSPKPTELSLVEVGGGVGGWFHNEDADGLHGRLLKHDVPIVQVPFENPFGTTFSFRDLDGYVVTIHSKA